MKQAKPRGSFGKFPNQQRMIPFNNGHEVVREEDEMVEEES